MTKIAKPGTGLAKRANLNLEGLEDLYKSSMAKADDKTCLPKLAKVAVGILSWPIAQLVKPQRFKGHMIRKLICDEQQQPSAIEWEVKPDSKLGMPTMLSMRLLFALCQLAWDLKKQTGSHADWITLPSWNKLCETLGMPPVQGNRALLQNHLKILHSTMVTSIRAFRTESGRADCESHKFYIVPSVRLKGELDADEQPYESTSIRLPKEFLDSIDNEYVKTIDLAFMAELANDAAQLLYTKISYLLNEAIKQGKDSRDVDYQWLAERMGLTCWEEKFRAKEQLKPAFEALVETQYIQKPEWWIDGSWKIRIKPGIRFEFGEQRQLQLRKLAAQKNGAAEQISQLTIPLQSTTPSPEDERKAFLIRMATRINTGRKINTGLKSDVDTTLLEANGWTLEDLQRKAEELKPSKKLALENGDRNADGGGTGMPISRLSTGQECR